MRIEHGYKELGEFGYQVVGNVIDKHSPRTNSNCEPIAIVEQSLYDWEALAKYIRLEAAGFGLYEVFNVRYMDILYGDLPGWQLSEFRVYMGMLALYFGEPTTRELGILWIRQPEELNLVFKLPYTRLGVKPTYEVKINCCEASNTRKPGDGFERYEDKYIMTQVDEDFGFMWTRNFIKLKDPTDHKDKFFHLGNSYAEITEHIGL